MPARMGEGGGERRDKYNTFCNSHNINFAISSGFTGYIYNSTYTVYWLIKVYTAFCALKVYSDCNHALTDHETLCNSLIHTTVIFLLLQYF